MKTKTINLYQYDELSDEAKEHAIEKLYDINTDYEWWESTYEDAANAGIKINSFDDYNCEGEFTLSTAEVAANIIRDHGDKCATYKTAQSFLDDINATEMPDDDTDEFSEWEDKMMELEEEFKKSILEDYRIILKNEYEYETSEEAIIETIKANEYDFDIYGNLI